MHLCHQLILGFSGTFSLPIYHSVKEKRKILLGNKQITISSIQLARPLEFCYENEQMKPDMSIEQHYKSYLIMILFI